MSKGLSGRAESPEATFTQCYCGVRVTGCCQSCKTHRAGKQMTREIGSVPDGHSNELSFCRLQRQLARSLPCGCFARSYWRSLAPLRCRAAVRLTSRTNTLRRMGYVDLVRELQPSQQRVCCASGERSGFPVDTMTMWYHTLAPLLNHCPRGSA